MKGTAILFQHDHNVTILEDVEKTTFEEIKEQCGCDHCTCSMENKKVDFGHVSPVLWHEDEVDWDYGY